MEPAGIFAMMWNHLPEMNEQNHPPYSELPNFSEKEMGDFISFIQLLQTLNGPINFEIGKHLVEEKGDYKKGKTLFDDKGCGKCHATEGSNRRVGPDLSRSDMAINYLNITTAMWNHNIKMRLLMNKMGIPMPRFTEEEMRNLVFYLKTERMAYDF